MSLSVRLSDPIRVIEERANVAIASHMNSSVQKKKSSIRDSIRNLAETWILEQPEIIALKNNELAAQLGLPFGSAGSAVDAIVLAIRNSVDLEIKKFDKRLKGGVTLKFQPSNFANLLSLAQGHVKLPESGDLHWLKWLLESGNKTIVVNYHFVPGTKGRSRGGVMGSGGAWRVPPQYAGTLENNFVTRAFSGKEKDIEKLLNNILTG